MTRVYVPVDTRVFDWLGSDSEGVSYYLHPLNLQWSKAGAGHDLGVYRRVAERLASEPEYWSAIIRNNDWRCSLVGSVCLLVAGHRGFFDDLWFRFESGSMVIPQLAVTMGLLHPAEARLAFELVLDDPLRRNDPVRLVSAERALACLGLRADSSVTLDGWNVVDCDRAVMANNVVQRQWEFWSARA